MREIFEAIGRIISGIIDFFYPPFSRYMTLQFFRYGVTGVGNMLLDWVLFFIAYNFILDHQMLNLGFVTLSSHIAAFAVTFPITLFTGFLLQKYVTFTASELKGKTQLYRYMIVVVTNIIINYVGFKALVDGLHFYPTPSKMIITFVTVIFSYISQKKFTFKINPDQKSV